jgi:uncharacterized protein YkwD
VRVDRNPITLTQHTPCACLWDTTGYADGEHTLSLVRINPAAGREFVLESRRVTVANHPAPSPAPEAVAAAQDPDFIDAPPVRIEDAVPQSLAQINVWRLRCGMTALTTDPRLALAATHHAAYLASGPMADDLSHTETPGVRGYSGRMPTDRGRAAGFRIGGVWEDVANGAGTAAMDRLFDAPYHRVPFLRPDITCVGVGVAPQEEVRIRRVFTAADEATLSRDRAAVRRAGTMIERTHHIITVVEFGATGSAGAADPVVYPLDGQKDVPVSWNAVEIPSPLRMHAAEMNARTAADRGEGTSGITGEAGDAPATGVTVGYVISYLAPDGPIRIVSAQIWSHDGAEVDCYRNTPDNDDHIHGALLIPKRPLHPATRYDVDVEAETPAGDDLSRRWSFTTASAVPATAASDAAVSSSAPAGGR